MRIVGIDLLLLDVVVVSFGPQLLMKPNEVSVGCMNLDIMVPSS